MMVNNMAAPVNVTLFENATAGNCIDRPTTMEVQEVDRLLWVYWSPFTFVTGMLGNILVIKIFCFSNRKKITTATTTVYFIVMAIADACFLLFGILPEWLSACRFVTLQTLHPTMCKLEKFLFYTSGDVAIWIICVNTMDRFIAVCFPFTQQKIRRVTYAKIASFITFILAVAKNIHVFWTRGLEYSDDGDVISICGRPKQYEYFELYVRPWIAFILVALVPCLVLTVFNIFIMRFLMKERRRKKLNGRKHHPDFLQTIIMCVSVSAAFVILVTPSLILYIGKPYWRKETQGGNYSYKIAKAVSNQLSYVNHAINFLLYCITAKKFRDEVFKIILPLNVLRDYIMQKHTIVDQENATILNKGEAMDTPSMKRSLRFSGKRRGSSKSLNQANSNGQSMKKKVLQGSSKSLNLITSNRQSLKKKVIEETVPLSLVQNLVSGKEQVLENEVNCHTGGVNQTVRLREEESGTFERGIV